MRGGYEDCMKIVLIKTGYFNGFVWGLPAMFMLTSNRQIAIATKDPFFPYASLIFVLGYQLADTGLSYCLVNGKCFLPNLGFAGLSYSNSITVWATVLSFTAYMVLSPRYRDYGITHFHTKNFWADLWEKKVFDMFKELCYSTGPSVSCLSKLE